MPEIDELATIFDLSAPGCLGGAPCIDPIFGPTATFPFYWSATFHSGIPAFAWNVLFDGAGVNIVFQKPTRGHVRAVRSRP
jgi:hypothetical protein